MYMSGLPMGLDSTKSPSADALPPLFIVAAASGARVVATPYVLPKMWLSFAGMKPWYPGMRFPFSANSSPGGRQSAYPMNLSERCCMVSVASSCRRRVVWP